MLQNVKLSKKIWLIFKCFIYISVVIKSNYNRIVMLKM